MKITDKQITEISILMSKILRHAAHKEKIIMDTAGFIKIDDLLKINKFKQKNITKEDIIYIVNTNKKNRFEIVDNKIRARQGHSYELFDYYNLDPSKILDQFKPILDTFVVHGTFKKNIESIITTGLNGGFRKHIHFTLMKKINNKYTQIVESGIRFNVEALIILDINKAIEEGIIFYQASNGVILTEGLNGILYKNNNNFISEIVIDPLMWK